MVTKADIVTQIKSIKPMLSADFAVSNIGIFGSFATDSQTENSDVDIIVELSRPIGWRFFRLEMLLEQTLGRKVDLVTKNALKKQLRSEILSTVIYI